MTNRHRKTTSGGGREGERVQAGCNLSFMLWRHVVNCSLSAQWPPPVPQWWPLRECYAPMGYIERTFIAYFLVTRLLKKELSIIINCTNGVYVCIYTIHVYIGILVSYLLFTACSNFRFVAANYFTPTTPTPCGVAAKLKSHT